MLDNLLKLGELGPLTIIALVLLLVIAAAIAIAYLFFFKLFPRMHGEAMQKATLITSAINQNTEEIRTSRRDSETRHDVIIVHLDRIQRKQQEMHNDFLSDEQDVKRSEAPRPQRREAHA